MSTQISVLVGAVAVATLLFFVGVFIYLLRWKDKHPFEGWWHW